MLDVLRKYVLNSWFAVVGIVISAISFMVGLLGVDFIISQTGYWIIAIVTLIVVLLNSILALSRRNEALTRTNKVLTNPDVSFEIESKPGDISFPNIRLTTDRRFFNDTASLNEVVEMKFYTNIHIRVAEVHAISIKFELVEVITDLPLFDNKYRVEISPNYPAHSPKNIIKLDGGDWQDIQLYLYFNLSLSPVEEKLPILGKATNLTLRVRATQSNAGYKEFDLSSSDAIEQIEEVLIKDMRHRSNKEINMHQFIDYLKMMWKQ